MKRVVHAVKHHAKKIYSHALKINKWLLLAIVVVILGFFALAFFLNTRLEKIFSYVPKNVTQVFVIRVRDNNNVLYQGASQQIAGDFQETLKQIEIAVIAQKTVDKIQENLIFVQAKPEFDPQMLLDAINSDAEISYIYQKLEGSLYVFGKPESLKYIKADSTNTFFGYEKLKSFKKLLRTSDISFFSRVESDMMDVTQLTPFLANLDYFVYGLKTSEQKLSMEADLVYKNNRQTNKDYVFKPLLNTYLNDKSLLFVELGSVIQQMGIKKEDFLNTISYFLKSQGLTLSSQEYESLYESFNTNIGVGIGEGKNLLGIGLAIIFKNSDLFGILSKIVPTVYQQVLSIPVMSGFDISLVQESDRQGFSSLVGGVQEVGLYAQKGKDSTLVTLGDPETTPSETPFDVDYTKNTLGYFYADFDNIIALYKKFGGSMGLGDAADQFSFFEKKILKGQIISESDKVQVMAVIE